MLNFGEHIKIIHNKQNLLDDVLDEVISGLAECEFLSNFLSQFPPKASFEVLSQILRERNSSLDEMKKSLGVNKDQEENMKHASDLLNFKRNALELQKEYIEKQMEDNERKLEISKEMGEYMGDNDGDYVDIREELVDSALVQERSYPRQNHKQSLTPVGTLDPEIEALLNAAEAEEEAANIEASNDDSPTPKKKVTFAEETEEVIIEHDSDGSDFDLAPESEVDDDDISFEDEWEDPSHIMGIPKQIIEQYMKRDLDPQKLKPMKQDTDKDMPGLTIKEITERLYGIEGLSDEDSVDDEYDLKQRELDTAYVMHKRRYESRMKQEIFEQNIDADEYLYRKEEEKLDIVEKELANTLRQVVTLDNDSVAPKKKPETQEEPKRMSRFKASMKRIVR